MRLLKRKGLQMKPAETTYQKPDTVQENLSRRFAILGIIIIVAFALMFTRLWFMQIVGGTSYKKESLGITRQEIAIEAPRGAILDRNGKVLVKNHNVLTISVVPAELAQDDKVIGRLSKLLNMGENEIKTKIKTSRDPGQRAVLIKADVPEETVTYVREHQREFTGVKAGTKPMRWYPNNELAAHVLGYLGEISEEKLAEKKAEGYKAGDEIGVSGIECTYDEELRGKPGNYVIEVDAMGNFIRQVSKRIEPRAGKTVRLTLDQNVQSVVESSLKWQVEAGRGRMDPETGKNYAATGASAVVLDPKTGEVIAMASYPTFNLNDFSGGISASAWKWLTDKSNNYPLNNRAIMSELPPGSTFKIVTAIAALTEGTFQMASRFTCNHTFTEGAFKDYPKVCWSTHHDIDLLNGIIQSCDVAFYTLGYSFYNRQQSGEGRNLWEYAADFQMGKATGIDLISEMNGRVPTPEWKHEFNKDNPDPQYRVWYPGDTVNMAIGQGDVLATPLQMAYVFAGVANGGKFMRPHLMKTLEDQDGKEISAAELEMAADLNKEKPEAVISVSQALTGVVKGKGTAAATFEGFPLDAIPVAGKTGTSEIIGKQPTAWFVCYAPANDPKYVVAVAIEEGGHGGETAAPVARRILEALFGLQPQGEIRPSVGD